MGISSRELPVYDNPPVSEVVFGATFKSHEGLTTAHLGRWWDSHREEYPTAVEVPPLAPIVEQLDPTAQPEALELFPTSPRIWLVNGSQDRLLQLQRDRLLCNWRRIGSEGRYPHYAAVSNEFFDKLGSFESFVQTSTGQPLMARQYELTYVNHVSLADGISSAVVEPDRVIADMNWRSSARFLPLPEAIDLRSSFRLPSNAGRLHVRISSGKLNPTGDVLVIDLTARGILPDRRAWFELAHEWIVSGFADVTSASAQRGWGLRS